MVASGHGIDLLLVVCDEQQQDNSASMPPAKRQRLSTTSNNSISTTSIEETKCIEGNVAPFSPNESLEFGSVCNIACNSLVATQLYKSVTIYSIDIKPVEDIVTCRNIIEQFGIQFLYTCFKYSY